MGEIAEVFKDDIVKDKINSLVEALLISLNPDGTLKVDVGFTDRGDPAGFDYTEANFPVIVTWTDIDLSSIVPAGAKAILIQAQIMNPNFSEQYLKFRKNGNTNAPNASIIKTDRGGYWWNADLVIICDTNRTVEYYNSHADTDIKLIIRGWWL